MKTKPKIVILNPSKAVLFSGVSEEISAAQLWFLALKNFVFSAVQSWNSDVHKISGNEQRWKRPVFFSEPEMISAKFFWDVNQGYQPFSKLFNDSCKIFYAWSLTLVLISSSFTDYFYKIWR